MPELRWILLVLGLVIVVGIFLWGRRRARPDEPTAATTRVEPHLADEVWLESHDGEDRTSAAVAESHAGIAEPSDGSSEAGSEASQRILALHVRAAAGEAFSGPQLEQAFAAERLEFGLYDAYHFKTDSGQTAFTVVSMVEPGTFPADGMEEFATPGLTMFMLLSAADGVESLSRMVACARRLASRLDAEVLDQDGSTFTNQRAAHMKEEIVEYLRQSRLDAGVTDRL